MSLRALRAFVLPVLVAITFAPQVFAQSPTDAELQALKNQADAYFQAKDYNKSLIISKQWAAATEKAEATKGRTRDQTAAALGTMAWYALFAQKPREALRAAERAFNLAPDELWIDINRAHALLLSGKTSQAIQAYVEHKGETVPGQDRWEDVIVKDFAELRARGFDAEKFRMVEKALAQAPQSPEVANEMAMKLHKEGHHSEALPLYEQYAADMKARHGQNAPQYAKALNNLARVFKDTNRLSEAESLYRRALAIYEKSFGPSHPKVATVLSNLAGPLQDLSRFSEAEPLLRRALTIHEKSFGPDHPDVALNLNNLAVLLQATNRLSEAEPLMRRALAIHEKNFGSDHPAVATDLNNLSQILEASNRLSEAEPLIRRALAIHEKSFGPDHPDVAMDLNNLAALLHEANRFVEAEPLMRRALAIYEKSFGPDHPNLATALNNLAQMLKDTNHLSEAEPLIRRALDIHEKSFGPDHPAVATDFVSLAALLQDTNRFSEAELLKRRALAINEKSFGPDHPNVAVTLNNLALLLQATNRYSEAESFMRRALAIDEKSSGPDHPNVARDLNNLAVLLQATNRYSEAEQSQRRAWAIDEKSFGSDHSKVARDLNNLAVLLLEMNRLDEAEPLMRRALAIDEMRLGPDHPEVAIDINSLVGILQHTSRFSEVEPLLRRALAIDEKSFGPEHPRVAIDLNNLAALLNAPNRMSEAEPLMRRTLSIDEKSFGPDHPSVARDLHNLAVLLWATGRLSEAEPLQRRALAIEEKSFGRDHPKVAGSLNVLAQLLADTNRLSEAEQLYRSALAINEKSFGPDHPHVADDLHYLAVLAERQARWPEAVVFRKMAKPKGANRDGLGKAMREWDAGSYARALYHAGASNETSRAEGFEAAQWALQNDAAEAVSAMAARFAKGGYGLGRLVRDEQDLSVSRESAYRSLDVAVGKADAPGTEKARAAIAQIEASLAEKQAELRQSFPDYAELADPRPLSLAEAQALLGDKDALVMFLDLNNFDMVRGETIIFALTNKQARWTSIDSTREDLRERVTTLRCGLDSSNWRFGEKTRQTCKSLLGSEVTEDQEPPFDLASAYALYRDLFAGVEDLIQGKRLLIVPSRALTQLPFEVLVTDFADAGKYGEHVRKAGRLGVTFVNLTADEREAAKITSAVGVKISEVIPGEAAEKAGLTPDDIVLLLDGKPVPNRQIFAEEIQSRAPGGQVSLSVLRDGTELWLQATLGEMQKREWIPRLLKENEGQKFAWLGQRQAITILPSVGSLKALRAVKASAPPEPFAGFGNPLLTGADGADRSAWARQECGKLAPLKKSRIANLAASITSLFRGGAVNMEDLRRQPPLPETADELCTVGHELGVSEEQLNKTIYLGERATVSKVKALSASGDLARARVVHFATHGLLASETALLAKAKAEPALLLTPPHQASEEDNGLLTASEVAQLNLNADWVVMSACNTAAGSAESAEALSGLARAFFYAGARSLLVSHWYVDSEAAIAITTGAVNAMKADPKIDRAEGLRRSEAALIARGGRFAHPSVWAPFVLVGNGDQ